MFVSLPRIYTCIYTKNSGVKIAKIKQKQMNEKIIVQPGVKAAIRKKTGASYLTIRCALNGMTNTPLSRRIRRLAMNRGGKIENYGKRQ